MQAIRQPAVAGAFYPGSPQVLQHDVQALLAAVKPEPDQPVPKAIIVPHAGYIYSGSTAAKAYARLLPARARIRRVVMLGPVHRVPVRGLALPGASRFATPLGEIEIDVPGVAALKPLRQVVTSPEAHAMEHSLEVQLPFLQAVLDDFTLLPLAVGNATPDEVAQVLDALWGGPETLVVISSDLSHFLPYASAQAIDSDTVQHIMDLDGPLSHDQACGGTPINGMLLTAKRRQLTPQLLGLCNSGDTAGDRGRVVGYASIAFTEPDGAAVKLIDTTASAAGGARDPRAELLLGLARAAIERALGRAPVATEYAEWLEQPAACFVTLTQRGQLRGCIGSLQAHRTLLADLQANAVSAALRDPRFKPLTAAELDHTEVEISLLSELQPIHFRSESDALAQLRPGVDGVVLEYGSHRGTFLPQVWDQLPERTQFMAHLKHKASLPVDFWHTDVTLKRYTVAKFKESDLRRGARRQGA